MKLAAIFAIFILISFLLLNGIASAEGNNTPLNVTVSIGGENGSGGVSSTLKIALFLTVMSLLPGILLSMTSFLRIIIVLSFVRQAMGMPQMPPAQIMAGIAIFLTMYIMTPVWQEINAEAIQPYINKEISEKEAFEKGMKPMREFMLAQTRKDDVALFAGIAGTGKPANPDDIAIQILIPAFITSELKTAFQMGFVLYLPFIVIDAVISTTLTAMGMFMLPPVMISMPFKLILFVLADGWHLVIQSLVSSFKQ